MGLETSRKHRDIDIDIAVKNGRREFKFSTSKQDLGRGIGISNKDLDYIRSLDKLHDLIDHLGEIEPTKPTNSKFHDFTPPKEEKAMSPHELKNYLDTLPKLDEEESHLSR